MTGSEQPDDATTQSESQPSEAGRSEEQTAHSEAKGDAITGHTSNTAQPLASRNLSNKPQDFQVRVKVIQARQLQGGNIHPVTRVKVLHQTQQTRIQRSTNTPYWNQTFFYNLHISPLELLDGIIKFQVFNSKRLRADALIGAFQCDLAVVYDKPHHALLNTWLLLGDPEDNLAGAKGYLKVSVVILGPGDEAPSMRVSDMADDEDIESNLLRPAGIQLRPAMFKVKVYRAEDLPKMDSSVMEVVKRVFGVEQEKGSFVDPYLVLSFAGTETKTKTVIRSDNPEWNQELRMGLQFPSMCERMKFAIKDWDRLSKDDTVGICFLSLPLISSFGNKGISHLNKRGITQRVRPVQVCNADIEDESGYLPTFGPCFINFYGSTREYSHLPDECQELNEGKGEGVAYRGRALIEIETVLGETPEKSVEDIDEDDLLRVQKYMRRRKFRIHATFLAATMISATDAPVQFEVSIGNYGNNLDEDVVPSASTTQPTNAVFDGCKYYYLPWGGTKPCLEVDCSFEDISWRLETLNLLLRIVADLEANTECVRIAVKAKLPLPELAQLLISLLDKLILDCRKPLPQPQKGLHVPTELDLLTAKRRLAELAFIARKANDLRLSATDVDEALSEVDGYLTLLRNMAVEPQNSMPDVIIWMISGQKRIAYYRIPAYDIYFSARQDYRGRLCGKLQTIQLKYPSVKGRQKSFDIPALLRVNLWLGLKADERQWRSLQTEGELAVFAETYENQVSIIGKWTNKGPTMTRPKFSDSEGKIELPKDAFEPPAGWKWDGDWYISPELSMLFGRDAGHSVFMEDVYECQSRVIPGGPWVMAPSAWTDVRGFETASTADITLPRGWRWVDDWQVDFGRAVDEDGFEYCVEPSLGGYGPVERTYHLWRRRRLVRTRENEELEGKNKAKKLKAAQGWEYAPLFHRKFHAIERKTDMVRRRRWHRKMVAEDETAACFFNLSTTFDEVELQTGPKFRRTVEKALPTSSRRKKGKLHRVKGTASKKEVLALTAPRMYLSFEEPVKYQLRAYIYHARGLLAADDTGLSDPYAQVCCLTQSMVTETVSQTLCPTWDQTLIFREMDIYGRPKNHQTDPPDIYIEIFDHDLFGAPDYLGRTKAQPMVKLDPADPRVPVLQWFHIMRGGKPAGELLAAFELFRFQEKKIPFYPPKRGNLYTVPNGIRPVLQRTGIEVLCWGVRNMKKYHLSSVTSPSIQLECGGHARHSSVIKDTKKNPNFHNPVLFFDVMLPKEELYMPPMNISVVDHRHFGRHPIVGVHVLKSLERYRFDPWKEPKLSFNTVVQRPLKRPGDVIVEIPEQSRAQSAWRAALRLVDVPRFQVLGYSVDVNQWLPEDDVVPQPPPSHQLMTEQDIEELDWWSKYYASLGDFHKCKKYLQAGYYSIQLYSTELEKAEEHEEFTDFCCTFNLSRGKDDEDDNDGAGNVVGEFKGTFRMYPLPPDPRDPLPKRMLLDLPSSEPVDCVVRVYVLKASDLQPADSNGLADPYIEVVLGKKKLDNRDNYIANTLDAVFGRCFELTATIPLDKDLIVRVKDFDLLSSDDLIGETVIDLENRFLSRKRATCGIPPVYYESGVNQWRDSVKPKDILEEYCRKNRLIGPDYDSPTRLTIGSRVLKLSDFEQNVTISEEMGQADQRLALHVLNALPVVKEHVERRPLFNALQPGIEQGKIYLWVDMFPQSLGPPGPQVDITPRKAKTFVLRCIIWNTVDVILEEESITGEKMSDIYVVGWMAGINKKQHTDVHYRSLDGEGNFNWRFVFPFDYLVAEQTLVVTQKEHLWSLDKTEIHTTPTLMIQIWDNDKFSADDFLGSVSLNLNNMPLPTKNAKSCSLAQLKPGRKRKSGSLFDIKHLRGFWPCYSDESGEPVLTGKVEMELELVTQQEAEEKPAGVGRDEPNANPTLDPPKRPETSFLWFTSPYKTLKHIIWRNYKWVIIGFIVTVLLALLVALFIYSFPGEMAHFIFSVVTARLSAFQLPTFDLPRFRRSRASRHSDRELLNEWDTAWNEGFDDPER